MNKPRIGILGGTYNPVHWGHVRSAEAVQEALHLDKVLMVPASLPPHKDAPNVDFNTRISMIETAISGNPMLEVCDIERQIQPSYTLKTLKTLHAKFDHAKFFLLMGHDTFLGLPSWYEWQNLLSYCHIVVINRAGEDSAPSPLLADLLQQHQVDTIAALEHAETGCIYFLTLPPVAISSTEIRKAIKQGKTISGLCPEGVVDFIEANHLYDGSSESDHFKRGTYAQ